MQHIRVMIVKAYCRSKLWDVRSYLPFPYPFSQYRIIVFDLRVLNNYTYRFLTVIEYARFT
jgi:hypothetical protein